MHELRKRRLIYTAMVGAVLGAMVASCKPAERDTGTADNRPGDDRAFLICRNRGGQETWRSRRSDYISSDSRNAEIWYIKGQGQYHQDEGEICGTAR